MVSVLSDLPSSSGCRTAGVGEGIGRYITSAVMSTGSYFWKSSLPLVMFQTAKKLMRKTYKGEFGKIPVENLPSPSKETVYLPNFDGNIEMLTWNKGNSGQPLFCLHGLNSHPWVWGHLAPLLARDFHFTAPIIAIALPAHGLSFTPTSTLTLHLTVAIVLDVLDTLRLSTVHLMGHSWGGKIAQALTAHAPSRVSTLTLCDPVVPQGVFPFPEPCTHPLISLGFFPERKTFPSEAAWRAGASEMLHLGWGSSKDVTDRNLWEGMFKPLPSTAPESSHQFEPRLSEKVFWDIVDLTLSKDIHEEVVSGITCPVLLFIPTMTVAPWPGAHHYLRQLPQIQVVNVSGCHTHFYSNPIDTATELARFLKVHSAAAESTSASVFEEDELVNGISTVPTVVSSLLATSSIPSFDLSQQHITVIIAAEAEGEEEIGFHRYDSFTVSEEISSPLSAVSVPPS